MNPIQNLEAAWHYHQGSRQLNSNEHEAALANFDRALKLQPEDYKAWFGRGMALGYLDCHAEALTSFEKALHLQPSASFGWHNRGIALGKLGRWSEALNSFDRALEFNPDSASIWHNRGLTLIDLECYESAVTSFERCLQLQPDASWAWYNRGTALLQLKRYREALNSFDRAIEFRPDDSRAWYNLGLTWKRLGRYKKAISCLTRSLSLQLHHKDKRCPKGITGQMLSEFQWKDYLNWYNRGVELGENGSYCEAIACYQIALELQPNFADAFYNTACCYARLGFAELALDHLQQAVELAPGLYQKLALQEPDFVNLTVQERFSALFQS